MKKAFLIGDSIRFGAGNVSPGYGLMVKEKLEATGEWEVFQPNENCRFAYYTLRYCHEWARTVPAEEIGVVHWNNGLWDALHLFDDDAFTPLEVYRDTIRRVYLRIRRVFPNAKVIFAYSTPVREELARPDFWRKNAEIEKYNAAAREVLDPFGVVFNDLYAFTKDYTADDYADWVHFSAEADSRISDEVAELIRSV